MPRSGRRKVITSINVEPDDYAMLKAVANRRRVPLAYVVREILHREVERWHLQQAPTTAEPAAVPA
jgi:predicted DNA-binding ribbon-helix-helix protein